MTGCRNIITVSYPMITNVVSLIPTDREVFLIQLFVIKFVTVSVLWKVSGYLWAFDPVSSTNKVDSHNITEILFKVAINIIGQALFELHFLYKKAELTFWREYFVTIFTLKTFAFPSLWLSNSLINMTFDLIIFIISLVSVVSI